MKNKIFYFILGIIITSMVVVGADYIYHANQVSYTPSNSNFDVDNVESAINDLYNSYVPKSQYIYNIEMGYLYLSASQRVDNISLFKIINSMQIRVGGGGLVKIYGVIDDENHSETLLESDVSNNTITLSNLSDYSYLKLEYVSGSSVGVYWTYIN